MKANRFIILIVAGFLFVVLSSFLGIFQNGVSITSDIPDVINAGTEITVNVSINKGKQTGAARFQQELPMGFVAKPIPTATANADFSFQDQKVRLVWLIVPDDNVINFSYTIVANERLKGEIDLDGQFTYSDNNEKKIAEMAPKQLKIIPSPKIAAEYQVDILDYPKIASIEEAAAGIGQTVALRQQPSWMEEDKMFLVTLLINKDAARKFAKIEEKIPAGFVAAGVDCKGGIFSFRNQMAQIIWMDLPPEPYFTITYKLIPEDASIVNQTPIYISGIFSFMISERTFTSPVVERTESLAGISNAQLNSILLNVSKTGPRQQPAEIAGTQTQIIPPTTTPSTPPIKPVTTGGQTAGGQTTGGQTAGGQTTGGQTTGGQTAGRQTTGGQTTGGQTTGVLVSANELLQLEPGIRYRVQIAAGHRQVSIPQTFRSYRLTSEVKREEHEGWYKYTIGPSFGRYKDARDYRVNLSNTTVIKDAFVSAYNNGRRITVQEALMALNEKWIP